MPIKTSSAKAKGRKFQQTIRDFILGIFTNQLEPDDVVSTSMGANGEDVRLSPRARQCFPYQIECKSRKSFSIYKDFEQASAHGDYEPLLFIKADRKKPLVVMSLDEFERIAHHDFIIRIMEDNGVTGAHLNALTAKVIEENKAKSEDEPED